MIQKETEAVFNFIVRGLRREDFTRTVYLALYGKFRHIAHFDIDGFYWQWFAEKRVCGSCKQDLPASPHRWIEYVLAFLPEDLNEDEKWIQLQARTYYSGITKEHCDCLVCRHRNHRG